MATSSSVQHEITSVNNAKLVIVPTTERSYGHVTTGRADISTLYLGEFLNELP
jgi:hypothetical protein